MSRFTVLAAICLLAVAFPVSAARMALLIGNSKYLNQPALANPTNDAALLATVLRDDLGFEDVRELADVPKRVMRLAIARFIKESAGAEVAFIYFSGHGMQPSTGGKSFLLPVDAEVNSDEELEEDGVSVERLVEGLEQVARPAKVRVVVLDACRNSPFGRNVKGDVKGLASVRPADQYTLVGFATRAGEVAQDGRGTNSPYASSLAKWLGRAREMPLRLIFEKAADDVKLATGQTQKPGTYGDLPSNVLLSGGVADDAVFMAEQKAWDHAVRLDTVAAYEAYLKAHPTGRFAALALASIRKLQDSLAQKALSKEKSKTDLSVEPNRPDPADRDAYRQARREKTPEAYRAYLKGFPQGAYRLQAAEELHDLDQSAYGKAAKLVSVDAYRALRDYLGAFPDGAFRAQAVEAIANLDREAFEGARAARSMEALKAYLEAFPDGVFAEAARKEVNQLQASGQFADCAGCPEMVRVPAGDFMMGEEYSYDASPRHSVSLKSFAIGRTEVTRRQWRSLMDTVPWRTDCPEDCPVTNISWKDVKKFIAALNRKVSGKVEGPYRLPSEAEWEYACRGGAVHKHCGSDTLADVGWSASDSKVQVQRVARKNPNGFGLFDMTGNAAEWVEDCYDKGYENAPTDGTARKTFFCGERVVRGGGVESRTTIFGLKATARDSLKSDYDFYLIGFRLARDLP